jgi:dCMP deaminase
MNKQLKWDLFFLRTARDLGSMSHCVSRQVGALCVLDGRILSSGINGTPAGEKNCDEKFPTIGFDPKEHRDWSDIHEVHGELNAILFAAKHGVSLAGSTIFCNLQPCNQCIKNIIQVGITRIVYSEKYDRVTEEQNQATIERLSAAGISYEYIQLLL